jgi:hypothetical protein
MRQVTQEGPHVRDRMIRNARNIFLLTLTLGPVLALSACAYLSGQNQACPPVSEISDPSTVALPAAPKPPPKDEVEPGPVASVAPAPTAEQPPPVADANDGGTPEGGALVAQKPDGGAPKKPPVVATTTTTTGGDAACGDREHPCPMQKFMRGTMGPAKTPDELNAAFTRLAGLSPNGGWQWRSIAQKGAELAKGGDAAAAKKQCKACHDQYKESYKQQYRARKF